MLPRTVSVGTPITKPTTAVAMLPYSKLTLLLASLRMPTNHCWPGADSEFHTMRHLLLGGTLARLDTFILNIRLFVPGGSKKLDVNDTNAE